MAGGNRLLLYCEMLETLRLQLPDAVLFGNANLAGLLCDLTDAGDPHAINSLWKPRGIVGRNGEQQLEILTAVQGQRQWIKCAASAEPDHVFVEGKGIGLDQRADVALVAQLLQIG